MTVPNTRFALIDGAMALDGLQPLLSKAAKHACLYMGDSATTLASFAPHLVQFKASSEFYSHFMQVGFSQHWGIVVDADCSLVELVHHFRKFLMVDTEDNRKLYFRFYDPRVLPAFLSTAEPKQLIEFFGPISQLTCTAPHPDQATLLRVVHQTLETQLVQIEHLNKATKLPKTHTNAATVDTVAETQQSKTPRKFIS